MGFSVPTSLLPAFQAADSLIRIATHPFPKYYYMLDLPLLYTVPTSTQPELRRPSVISNNTLQHASNVPCKLLLCCAYHAVRLGRFRGADGRSVRRPPRLDRRRHDKPTMREAIVPFVENDNHSIVPSECLLRMLLVNLYRNYFFMYTCMPYVM